MTELLTGPAVWSADATLRYTLEIPQQTPSNNEIKEMHFHVYKALRRKFKFLVLQALEGVRPVSPIERSFLVVRRFCVGDLDWDNAYGGLKPVLDCLVMPSKRNPDGLGLIVDDKRKWMPLPPFVEQHPAKRGAGRTQILVYELASAKYAQDTPAAA